MPVFSSHSGLFSRFFRVNGGCNSIAGLYMVSNYAVQQNEQSKPCLHPGKLPLHILQLMLSYCINITDMTLIPLEPFVFLAG